VIKSFRDSDTGTLHNRGSNPRFQSIERTARRKLIMLNNARNLDDLRAVPGNHLEVLKRERKGQYSIRINHQWRVCFRWDSTGGDAYEVEIVDYH
jgi:toxin HigB-1